MARSERYRGTLPSIVFEGGVVFSYDLWIVLLRSGKKRSNMLVFHSGEEHKRKGHAASELSVHDRSHMVLLVMLH